MELQKSDKKSVFSSNLQRIFQKILRFFRSDLKNPLLTLLFLLLFFLLELAKGEKRSVRRELGGRKGHGNPASNGNSNSALSNSKTIIGDQNEDKPNSTTERARTLSDPKLGVSHLHDAQRASRLQIQRAGSKTALS